MTLTLLPMSLRLFGVQLGAFPFKVSLLTTVLTSSSQVLTGFPLMIFSSTYIASSKRNHTTPEVSLFTLSTSRVDNFLLIIMPPRSYSPGASLTTFRPPTDILSEASWRPPFSFWMEGIVHLYLSLEAVACLKIPYPFVFLHPHDSVGLLLYNLQGLSCFNQFLYCLELQSNQPLL